MHNHAPTDYICPICIGLSGEQSDRTLIRPVDIIYADDLVTALINSFFLPGNEGHAIIVPNQHFENLYDLPHEYLHRIAEVSQQLSLAMRQAYECDGITTRQNNEPAGDQHAFHYHLHHFPRYAGDSFNQNADNKYLADPSDRTNYAQKLKAILSEK